MTTNQPPDFPAGAYVEPGDYDTAAKQAFVKSIESYPVQLAAEVAGLSDEHLDTKYRNWTIRQIIHHLADSHVNCYIRFKWTLTESTPTIKSYNETLWSQVADAQTAPVASSMTILDGIHRRWGQLLRRLDDEAMARGFFHPELDRVVTLKEALPSYVWHGQHHLGQIRWVKQNLF